MLKILLATCLATLDALQAADNPLDSDFTDDLQHLVARTSVELEQLAQDT
jgi:hypothetical protein